MDSNVVKRGLSGGSSTLVSSVVNILLNLLAVILLSRMLDPEDFGLVAMVQAIIALGELLKDAGISTAALQAKSLSRQQASNLFWVNLCLSAAVFVAIVLSSPLVVGFFSEPRLAVILPVAAVPILFHGLTAQIRVDLARRMRFNALAVSSIASQFAGVGVAVALAYFGFGYWALVSQVLISSFVLLIVQWALAKWRPARWRRGQGTLSQVRTGIHYALNQLLIFAENNATSMILGRTVGAMNLGQYNRASTLIQTPLDGVTGPLQRVAVPILNRLQANGTDTAQAFVKIQYGLGVMVVGVLSGASGLADILIGVLLGAGWEPAIQVFRVLAFAGCFQIFIAINYWAFIHLEASKSYLSYNLLARPLTIVGIIVGAAFGLQGVAVGFAIAKCVSWLAGLVWLAKLGLSSSLSLLFSGVIQVVGGLLSAFSLMIVVSRIASLNSGLILLVGFIMSFVILLLILVLIPMSRREIVTILRMTSTLRD